MIPKTYLMVNGMFKCASNENKIMERIDIKTWEDAAECAKHSNNVLKVYPPDRKGLYRFDIGKSIYAIKELHN